MDGQRGFTYLGMLFAIAFLGLMSAGTGVVWQQVAQRDREEQLLFVGRQFGRALAAYHAATPPGRPPEWPRRLEDLLEDRRQSPLIQRHLRRLYVDPMTDTTEWGLVRAGKEIVAIHSLSSRQPIKKGKFLIDEEDFAGAQRYDQWIFKPTLPKSATPGGTAATPDAIPKVASALSPADLPAALVAGAADSEHAGTPCHAELLASLRQCAAAILPSDQMHRCVVTAQLRHGACQ